MAFNSPSEPQCTGSPTFNLANPGDNKFSEWPSHIPGLICKTSPIGYYTSPRFSQCCSGPVYNITTPTTPDDPAYPMSCALFCQVDPELNESNERYPYGFGEHFMCLNDGMVTGEEVGGSGEVVCATVTAEDGRTMPESYESTWTGAWQTRSYVREAVGLSWTWVEEGETYSPLSSESTETLSSSTVSSVSMTSATDLETSETSNSSEEMTERTSMASSKSEVNEPAATTTGGDSTDDAASIGRWTMRSVLKLTLAAGLLML